MLVAARDARTNIASKSAERTPKLLRKGTHRSQSLEHTLKLVTRLLPVMGITRVANVTGLDQIGIPVVMVCRPNSRSVAVSQGKGINLASARASGLMEAAELYHAETMTVPLRLATYEELRYQHRVVEPDDLPRIYGSRFHPNLRILWCEGHDLLNNEKVWVPYEMVHTNYTTPLSDGHGCFAASSNGLASGNDITEAISHGICEVVERDATTLWKLGGGDEDNTKRIDLDSVDDELCHDLIQKFERAGLDVAVWDITSDIQVAAFACFIVPREDAAMWHVAGAAGYGCHPSREVALVRALTEAAQVRLTVISGLRDDFRGDAYDQLLDPQVLLKIRRSVKVSSLGRRFSNVPTHDGDTLQDDVAWEIRCIKKGGPKRVVVIDLTKPEFGVSVVRVIIPGLEPIFGSSYVPGQRGRGVLGKHS